MSLPKTQKALRLHAAPEGSPKGTRNVASVDSIPFPPSPQNGDDWVLLQIEAAGFNRRDEWSMIGAYPGLVYTSGDFSSIMGCDGVGTLHGDNSGTRWILNPTVGWENDPAGPEIELNQTTNQYGGKMFGIFGGTKATAGQGTFQEYIWVKKSMLVECPAHLSSAQASALPCGGVTAYRALFTKGQVRAGQNVLITGIGGGVALLALRMALAVGARVYVTGGSQAKIDKAISFGASDGANYKEKGWEAKVNEALPADHKWLDVVIDSAGGAIPVQSLKAGLRSGGKIVIFGMTATPKVDMTMREVLKNYELLGSTMGSLAEFKQCIELVGKHKIVPDIDTVLEGLDQAEQAFPMLADETKRSGGKIVVNVRPAAATTESRL